MPLAQLNLNSLKDKREREEKMFRGHKFAFTRKNGVAKSFFHGKDYMARTHLKSR